jgi:tetrahydromethanopterin S-methyltransferase subunit G
MGTFEQVNERLGSIDRRLDAIDTRFIHVDSRFNWVIGIVVSAWLTMIATQIGTTLTILLHH